MTSLLKLEITVCFLPLKRIFRPILSCFLFSFDESIRKYCHFNMNKNTYVYIQSKYKLRNTKCTKPWVLLFDITLNKPLKKPFFQIRKLSSSSSLRFVTNLHSRVAALSDISISYWLK